MVLLRVENWQGGEGRWNDSGGRSPKRPRQIQTIAEFHQVNVSPNGATHTADMSERIYAASCS